MVGSRWWWRLSDCSYGSGNIDCFLWIDRFWTGGWRLTSSVAVIFLWQWAGSVFCGLCPGGEGVAAGGDSAFFTSPRSSYLYCANSLAIRNQASIWEPIRVRFEAERFTVYIPMFRCDHNILLLRKLPGRLLLESSFGGYSLRFLHCFLGRLLCRIQLPGTGMPLYH